MAGARAVLVWLALAADLPQLVALGTLLGFSYVRSRNLATPMLIHGMWNGSVLTVLYVLSSQGIDINSMLQTAPQ